MNGLILFLIFWIIAGFVIFLYEIHKAPIVDAKEPFLHGDYDERLTFE